MESQNEVQNWVAPELKKVKIASETLGGLPGNADGVGLGS